MNTKVLVIFEDDINKTCQSCPAQWEGKDADGASIYIRYRYGRLQVQRNGILPEQGECIFYERIGEEFDGEMELYEVQEILDDHWRATKDPLYHVIWLSPSDVEDLNRCYGTPQAVSDPR